MILSPQLIKPHFKTDIYRGILAYLEKNYPALDIDQLCLDSGLPRSFLTTPGNWVSIKFAYEFTRLCKERTDNPRISFEAGRQRRRHASKVQLDGDQRTRLGDIRAAPPLQSPEAAAQFARTDGRKPA